MAATEVDLGRTGRSRPDRDFDWAWQLPGGETERQIRQALLEELRPVSLKNCTLRRFGSTYDGGYLMCENLIDGLEAAYSYGVGPNDEWGCDISTRYRVPVHQYDCFDPARPVCRTGDFVFHDECIGNRRENVESRLFDTLANQISRNGDSGKRLIVKIDVEGAEWDALMATSDAVLERIDQLPMELHGSHERRFLAGRSKAQTNVLRGQPPFQQLLVLHGDGALSQPRVPGLVGEQTNRRARHGGGCPIGKRAERARRPRTAGLPTVNRSSLPAQGGIRATGKFGFGGASSSLDLSWRQEGRGAS